MTPLAVDPVANILAGSNYCVLCGRRLHAGDDRSSSVKGGR
jgi:hypothetical protein